MNDTSSPTLVERMPEVAARMTYRMKKKAEAYSLRRLRRVLREKVIRIGAIIMTMKPMIWRGVIGSLKIDQPAIK